MMLANHQKDDKKNTQWRSVIELISNQQAIEEIRKQRNKFASRMLNRQESIKQIVKIGLQPQLVEKQMDEKIQRVHVNNSMELLGILTDTQMEQLFSESRNFLSELFQLFKSPKPIYETSLAYFTRLLMTFTYHHQKKMIQFLLSHGQSAMEHLYSKSLYEWFLNLLENQDGSEMEEEKVQLLNIWRTAMQAEKDSEILTDMMDNYACMMEWLGEGLQGRNLGLAQRVLQDPNAFKFLFPSLNNPRSPFHLLSLRIAETSMSLCLAHSTLSLHPETKTIFSQYISTSTLRSSQITSLIPQLRLFQTVLRTNRQNINHYLTSQNLEHLLSLLNTHKNNNILHNLIKDTVILGIKESQKVMNLLLREQSNFVKMMKDITGGNSTNKYENQLYHIMQAMLKKEKGRITEVFEGYGMGDCMKIIGEKEKFYSKIIGGAVRKDSSGWGDSSQEILLDPFFNKSAKLPQQDTQLIQGGNQHYFDCGLPLDSDESKDESSGNIHEKSINTSEDFFAKSQPILKQEQPPRAEPNCPDPTEEPYNHKHFNNYLSFSLDELFDEIH